MTDPVDLEERRPLGASALAGGLAAGGAVALLGGALGLAAAPVPLLATGLASGIALLAIGGLLALSAWGLWTLRPWAWWAAFAISMAALALTFGSVIGMLGALLLVSYLASVRGSFDARDGGPRPMAPRPGPGRPL
jgi:hypothetical protein